MSDALVDQVRAIQAWMTKSGQDYFLESELNDMNVLIRLNVEFVHALQREDENPLVEEELRYVCGSVFSGVDSFVSVSTAYRMLRNTSLTTLAPGGKSVDSIKEEFALKYREFSEEVYFEKRCRLLLDLFKLQIVFAGLSY